MLSRHLGIASGGEEYSGDHLRLMYGNQQRIVTVAMKLHNFVNGSEHISSTHLYTIWDRAAHESKLDLWLDAVSSHDEDVCAPFQDRDDHVMSTASINADEISRVRRMLTNNLRFEGIYLGPFLRSNWKRNTYLEGSLKRERTGRLRKLIY